MCGLCLLFEFLIGLMVTCVICQFHLIQVPKFSFIFNSWSVRSGCTCGFHVQVLSFMFLFAFNSGAGFSGSAIWFLYSGSCE